MHISLPKEGKNGKSKHSREDRTERKTQVASLKKRHILRKNSSWRIANMNEKLKSNDILFARAM